MEFVTHHISMYCGIFSVHLMRISEKRPASFQYGWSVDDGGGYFY